MYKSIEMILASITTALGYQDWKDGDYQCLEIRVLLNSHSTTLNGGDLGILTLKVLLVVTIGNHFIKIMQNSKLMNGLLLQKQAVTTNQTYVILPS